MAHDTGLLTKGQDFAAALHDLERERATQDPAWLRELRRRALARFGRTGFPTTRDEAWRQTNLSAVAETAFAPAPPAPEVNWEDLEPWLWDAAGPRLVFVNGRLAPQWSRPDALAAVELRGISDTLGGPAGGGLEPLLGHCADCELYTLGGLNTACLADGAWIRIPSGVQLEAPLHILHLALPGAEPVIIHPRTLIELEPGSQALIVETYAALGEGFYFSNAVTELHVGANAQARYCKVQREGEQAVHVGLLALRQERDSATACHGLSLGSRLARHELHARLEGAGGDCHLGGLAVVGGEQHVDHHLRVEHVAPHCGSREVFKNVLADRSRAVFTGRIVVHPGAQQTDGKQTNKNLLLSPDAHVDTQPQLEIFANDVKCTHGATIGQLDDDALFYLRSRGIPAQAARSLLAYAFVAESLGEVSCEPLRRQMTELVLQRLPGGRGLVELV